MGCEARILHSSRRAQVVNRILIILVLKKLLGHSVTTCRVFVTEDAVSSHQYVHHGGREEVSLVKDGGGGDLTTKRERQR